MLNKCKDAERLLAERERKAYINPDLAEEARNAGNIKFKAGDFAGSIADYTEAVKRNPEDPRNYTNRASAYTKLLAISEAMKDAEQAIKVDPTFTKAYCRMANVKFATKEYSQALDILEQARQIDKDGKTTTEINQIERKCRDAMYQQRASETDEERVARAQRDPEVVNILQDPVFVLHLPGHFCCIQKHSLNFLCSMQSILQEAQKNPQALMEHSMVPLYFDMRLADG